MTKRPRLTAKKLIAALRRAGFEVIRVRGSHHFLQHPEGRRTLVPVHSGETLGPGMFTKVLSDCEMSPEELQSLL